MNFSAETLTAAHEHSSNHRAALESSDICGCFYCCSLSVAAEVKEWIDAGQTALCPLCGIDSVIGSASGYPVNDLEFLKAMEDHWFGEGTTVETHMQKDEPPKPDPDIQYPTDFPVPDVGKPGFMDPKPGEDPTPPDTSDPGRRH